MQITKCFSKIKKELLAISGYLNGIFTVLRAIDEDNPAVPNMLADYILTGKLPNIVCRRIYHLLEVVSVDDTKSEVESTY